MMRRDLLTPAYVARKLRVERHTVYHWMHSGIIKYVEVRTLSGKIKKMIPRSELDDLLKEGSQ